MPLPEDMTILIVEDDHGHARYIEIMLQAAGFGNETLTLHNGREAADCLFSEGACAHRPRPHPLLVLLDLNLPGVNGHEILARIRATEETATIPVVVVTSSLDPDEEVRCRRLGADAFIVKPPQPEGLKAVFGNLGLLDDSPGGTS